MYYCFSFPNWLNIQPNIKKDKRNYFYPFYAERLAVVCIFPGLRRSSHNDLIFKLVLMLMGKGISPPKLYTVWCLTTWRNQTLQRWRVGRLKSLSEAENVCTVKTKLRHWRLWEGLSDKGWLHGFVGPSTIFRCPLPFSWISIRRFTHYIMTRYIRWR